MLPRARLGWCKGSDGWWCRERGWAGARAVTVGVAASEAGLVHRCKGSDGWCCGESGWAVARVVTDNAAVSEAGLVQGQ